MAPSKFWKLMTQRTVNSRLEHRSPVFYLHSFVPPLMVSGTRESAILGKDHLRDDS